jgi:hypothetical protein
VPVVETVLAVDQRGPAAELSEVGRHLGASQDGKARQHGERDESAAFHGTSLRQAAAKARAPAPCAT